MINSMKPIYRELRFRLTDNQSEIALRDEVDDLSEQWRSIVENSRDTLRQPRTGKHVLFVSGYGLGSHYLTFEPIIMMALYVRGCRITSLYCDKALPSCEFNVSGSNRPRVIGEFRPGVTRKTIDYQCSKCKHNLEEIYGCLPVDLTGLDRFLTGEDYELAAKLARAVAFEDFRKFTYDGVAVGEEAFASILRATFMGEVQDNGPNRFLATRYLMSGILTARGYEKAYTTLKPDHVVCIHGVYQTHGIAVKVANKLGIPAVVLGGGGIRKSTLVLCHGETYHHQLINEPNDTWKQFPLTDEQKSKTMDYAIKRRHSGAGVDYVSYHHNPIDDVEEVYRLCNIDKTRKIVSLFTNVIWDAQIYYNGNAFKDIFDWIVTSIETLGKNKNVWLVIRIHPAEAQSRIPPRQPMLAEIAKRFPTLPDNVRLVPPESDISSYTLAKESVANIIYGTKMGLEIALMKRPLIICGETFSRNKGYGIDISSKQQYEALLKDIHNISVDVVRNFETALQYAHYYYFRRMLDIPFAMESGGEGGSGKRILIEKLDDLAEGKFPAIDVICKGILELKPFYLGAS
jgi:hypothetical protein